MTSSGASTAEHSFREDLAALVASDEHLAAVVAEHGVPAFWARPAGFPSLVLFVLEQQVSLASAAATYRSILRRIDTMAPGSLLAHPDMRADGVSRQKERYLRALAAAVDEGTLDLGSLTSASDDEVRARLMALPGIGAWTADVYLLSCLGRPDLWPVGDRALQVAAAETLGLAEVPTPVVLTEIGERWRPRRSTAARILWHGYLRRRGRAETHLPT
ncbi:DNA-3-methyladenine glycosylase family protein [Pseudactinotalea terrae]|uniref:DNA-3-methyladenine glycosylase family protein n=1 Tax=Pseudactinotalea terrae TaxID=1743262 RepID=UPI0012E23D26|nr:DNA-3-methyladenine glycosylase [Pseudactinotalea terrae]